MVQNNSKAYFKSQNVIFWNVSETFPRFIHCIGSGSPPESQKVDKNVEKWNWRLCSLPFVGLSAEAVNVPSTWVAGARGVKGRGTGNLVKFQSIMPLTELDFLFYYYYQ